MRILQANNYGYVRGGSDRYALDLSSALGSRGHDVHTVVTADPRNVVETPWSVRGFRIETPRARDTGRFFYSRESRRVISRLLERERVDVAHLHIYYGQLTPSILGPLKKHGVPIVQTLHEYKLFCPVATMTNGEEPCERCCSGSFWYAVARRCNRGDLSRSLATSIEAYVARMLGALRDIDHFIAVSDFMRRTMVRFGIPGDRITTVHHAIDYDAFDPNYDAGDYFLYFGRVERIKGVMTLLAALKQTPVRLVVAGEGSLRAEVEHEAARQGLRVECVGFKRGKDLQDLVRGCRCVVVPSEWHETFGLVILEAYALGKPVIASRMGGMPEVVREGVTGMLFEAGNVHELAVAMDRLWNHPAEAAAMGRAGRRLAEESFGWEPHYERILSVYRKVSRR